jgi:hypothetical protein
MGIMNPPFSSQGEGRGLGACSIYVDEGVVLGVFLFFFVPILVVPVIFLVEFQFAFVTYPALTFLIVPQFLTAFGADGGFFLGHSRLLLIFFFVPILVAQVVVQLERIQADDLELCSTFLTLDELAEPQFFPMRDFSIAIGAPGHLLTSVHLTHQPNSSSLV